MKSFFAQNGSECINNIANTARIDGNHVNIEYPVSNTTHFVIEWYSKYILYAFLWKSFKTLIILKIQ